jgi:hypothetical protein
MFEFVEVPNVKRLYRKSRVYNMTYIGEYEGYKYYKKLFQSNSYRLYRKVNVKDKAEHVVISDILDIFEQLINKDGKNS